MGLKLKKIHRILELDSRIGLKKYIDFNTSQKKGKERFRKRLFQVDVQLSFQ